MREKGFQDYYPDDLSHCFGCGRLNEYGHRIRSFWDGDESIAEFTPEPYHTAIPGFVYGGLLASIIDCHGTGTASAAAYRRQGREMGSKPVLRFVTASLKVDYLRPTPIGVPLILRGRIKEMGEKKAIVEVRVSARDTICVRGEVTPVLMPESMKPAGKSP